MSSFQIPCRHEQDLLRLDFGKACSAVAAAVKHAALPSSVATDNTQVHVMNEMPRRMARKSGGHFTSGSRYGGQQAERDAYFQGLSEIFDFSGEEQALEVSFMIQRVFARSFAATKRMSGCRPKACKAGHHI